MSNWMLRQTTANIDALAHEATLHPVVARILAVRGHSTPLDVSSFLSPESQPLSDPLLFADMSKAAVLSADAIQTNKKCVVYGDYDADGIISTFILLRTLRSLHVDVDYYIPNRDEGYGLNNKAILALAEQGYELIYACDNGVSAFEQIEYANTLGLAVIVLDHHSVQIEIDNKNEKKQVLPNAAALVNAKRIDCQYPFSDYCAAGVCYRFSEALYAQLGKNWQSLGKELLPFVAIATICDLVELTGENRTLVKRGVNAITTSGNMGLQALLRASGLANKEVDSYSVGFILGPCINASGRLDTADKAVDLFLAEDAAQAGFLAEVLVTLNEKRKELTKQGTQLAINQLHDQGHIKDNVIVLYCPEVSASVAGIVAGRIKEQFYRPTIILAGENEFVQGSCRSIEKFNIYEALFHCRELFQTFGGHPMAAGLTIHRDNIDTFREKINAFCELEPEDFQPSYRIDCPLLVERTTLSLAKQLAVLEPHGAGNPVPLFAAKHVLLKQIVLVGKEEQVMRWSLQNKGSMAATGILFYAVDKFRSFLDHNFGEDAKTIWRNLLAGKQELYLDILYNLRVNSFNGKESAQLSIVDYRIS